MLIRAVHLEKRRFFYYGKKTKKMNSYELSKNWFQNSFENPDLIKPNHTALYFFIIELCNRLGWKEKFGLPTSMVMEAIGVKNYKTYKKALSRSSICRVVGRNRMVCEKRRFEKDGYRL